MNYLKYLVEEIHTTIVATVDDVGQPVTAAIDMMDYDEGGLYFDDPELGVEWPMPEGMTKEDLIISEKDHKWGGIKDLKK